MAFNFGPQAVPGAPTAVPGGLFGTPTPTFGAPAAAPAFGATPFGAPGTAFGAPAGPPGPVDEYENPEDFSNKNSVQYREAKIDDYTLEVRGPRVLSSP